MSDITLSSAVRSNLLSLQNTADLLGKTQERLATGLEVNSALDNPTNFFTAASLNGRAGDLSRLLDGVSNATQTLEAADNGISAITSLVESAQASARQALQAPGQETVSQVEGDSGATFNPQALSSVAGDNALTGALDADAAATVDTGSITGDTAQADFDFSTSDLGDGVDDLTAFTDGDIFTISVNGATTAIRIGDDGAAGAVAGATNVGVDRDAASGVDALIAAINNIDGISATDTAVEGRIDIETDAGTDVVKFGDENGTPLTTLGLNAVGTADASGDRVSARNSDLEELVAAGDTLQVGLGGSNLGTITFGESGVGSKDALITALNNLNGVDATGTAGAPGAITVTTSDENDADSAISFTASDNNALETVLGFSPDTTGGTTSTTQGTNLLNNQSFGSIEQGDTLNIRVGNSTQLNITFGNNVGQVSTLAELNQSLQGLAGGAASVDTDGIDITADNAGDTIQIGGTDDALAAVGLRDADVANLFGGEANSLLDGTNITDGDVLSIQVGTNNPLNITFGTAAGEVNSLSELEDTLGNLAGGRASIDDTTGAITVEATQGTDAITITSADSLAAEKNAVAASFGLTSSATPVDPVTTDSETRADARSQYNELLIQIDEIAEDSGFNGVNLLNGDDLQVIFNEDGSSTLDIDGVNFDSSSLGLSRLNSGAFQSDGNIEATLDTLDNVINTLRSQASQFGSNLSVVETRENFTRDMINTLETGAANLTLADSNEEGANLTALQTRQTLSTTALSLATQSDQNVLRLF